MACSSRNLAERSGRDKDYICKLEASVEPSWELLVELCVFHMGIELEDLEAVVWAHRRARGLLPHVPDSPIPLTASELREIRRVSGPFARLAAAEREDLMIREIRAEKVRQAREEAGERCTALLAATGKARRALLAQPAFRSFAVAERLCDLSEQAAAKSWKAALRIARLAWRVARLLPGTEAWRQRVRAYCLAFVANAWRVAATPESIGKAERIFERAADLWDKHQAGDPDRILALWRLPDLQASLRRDQRRFPEALRLHAQALAAAPREAWARVMVKRASTLDQMFEAVQALQVLQEAAPLIAEAPEPRLAFIHAFLMSVNLCHLERFGEGAEWLRVASARANALRNERDLVKVRWLGGRVAAGLGQEAKALESFRVVRSYFQAEELAYDYALASAEEAVLLFHRGQGGAVQRMVLEDMAWVFQAKGIHREALAALALLRQAVERATATQALARRVYDYLLRAKKNPALRFEE